MTFKSWSGLALGVCAGLVVSASSARAAVRVELVDRGVPTGAGAGVLPAGFRAKVVRIVSDDAPILSIDAARSTGPHFDQNLGIFGGLLHYDVDPTGQYDFQPTPLDSADNSSPTLLNFDSHFLPLPAGATYTVAPYENGERDFMSVPPFPTSFSAFQSARVGIDVAFGGDINGIPWLPESSVGRLSTVVDLSASSNLREVEFAYLFLGPWTVAADSPIQYRIDVATSEGSSLLQGNIEVPEPAFGSLFALLLKGFCRRRRQSLGASFLPVVSLDRLERRLAQAVDVPQNVAAVMVQANMNSDSPGYEDGRTPALISWEDVQNETAYRVEVSAAASGSIWTTAGGVGGTPPATGRRSAWVEYDPRHPAPGTR